jgi:hypothetical protein
VNAKVNSFLKNIYIKGVLCYNESLFKFEGDERKSAQKSIVQAYCIIYIDYRSRCSGNDSTYI